MPWNKVRFICHCQQIPLEQGNVYSICHCEEMQLEPANHQYRRPFTRWCLGDNQSVRSSVPVVSRCMLWPGNRTILEVASKVVIYLLGSSFFAQCTLSTTVQTCVHVVFVLYNEICMLWVTRTVKWLTLTLHWCKVKKVLYCSHHIAQCLGVQNYHLVLELPQAQCLFL